VLKFCLRIFCLSDFKKESDYLRCLKRVYGKVVKPFHVRISEILETGIVPASTISYFGPFEEIFFASRKILSTLVSALRMSQFQGKNPNIGAEFLKLVLIHLNFFFF
jgi:hypothetical protein